MPKHAIRVRRFIVTEPVLLQFYVDSKVCLGCLRRVRCPRIPSARCQCLPTVLLLHPRLVQTSTRGLYFIAELTFPGCRDPFLCRTARLIYFISRCCWLPWRAFFRRCKMHKFQVPKSNTTLSLKLSRYGCHRIFHTIYRITVYMNCCQCITPWRISHHPGLASSCFHSSHDVNMLFFSLSLIRK